MNDVENNQSTVIFHQFIFIYMYVQICCIVSVINWLSRSFCKSLYSRVSLSCKPQYYICIYKKCTFVMYDKCFLTDIPCTCILSII